MLITDNAFFLTQDFVFWQNDLIIHNVCIVTMLWFAAERFEGSIQRTVERINAEEKAGTDQNQDAAKQTANSILALILSFGLLCRALVMVMGLAKCTAL